MRPLRSTVGGDCSPSGPRGEGRWHGGTTVEGLQGSSGRQGYEFPKPKDHILGRYLDVEAECLGPKASEEVENRVVWVPPEFPWAFPYRDWASPVVTTFPEDGRIGFLRWPSSR